MEKIVKSRGAVYRKKHLLKKEMRKDIIVEHKVRRDFFMREPMYIRQAETESIMGDRIVLYYYTTEKKQGSKDAEIVKYGVGIDMYTQLPNQRALKEQKVVDGLFNFKREAEKFIDILCDGLVTPSTLEDIISDNLEKAYVV